MFARINWLGYSVDVWHKADRVCIVTASFVLAKDINKKMQAVWWQLWEDDVGYNFDVWHKVVCDWIATASFVLVDVIRIQAAWYLLEVDVGYNINVCHKSDCVCIAIASWLML